MEKWVVSAKRADFAQIGKEFGIDAVTARIIRNRDVVGADAIRSFLYGDLSDLFDPEGLKGCRKIADTLLQKIADGLKIRIIGDYDIDGVSASFILVKGLRRLGAKVDVQIPDRIIDGYGVNVRMIQEAKEEQVDTILTCDNGISALGAVTLAKELGMTVLVTDHHEPLYQEQDGERNFVLPAADAICNPKQPGCHYPNKGLCGAAVAFKLVSLLYRLQSVPEKEMEPFLEMAAFATIGDVMDLQGENRILVKEGLKRINHTSILGLQALIDAVGLKDKTISSYHIGFVLGPCINASGRLHTAKAALSLLLEESFETAREKAEELKEQNEIRKEMTAKGTEQALAILEKEALCQDKVLLIYLPDCHESLVGIIAGRIKERFHKPTFVFSDSADADPETGNAYLKGSGRSIEAYSMFDELVKCKELLVKFGGHPMAAGLSLKAEAFLPLRKALNENTTLTEQDFIEKVTIDVPMPIDYVTMNLIHEFALLEPFGKGNSKPVFAEKDFSILSCRVLGKQQNVLKLQLCSSKGAVVDGLYFGDIPAFFQYVEQKFGKDQLFALQNNRRQEIRMDFIYYPDINEFRGISSIQMMIQYYQ